ncbi:hypothetical protein KIV40_10945 [Vibrio sp. D173a]|uniref:hypothetical protein n=1 Tax=Vibrio sp. D173a TaxID=2836349 RepID=UPI002557BD14|nr:hypothetical protein [Vibrio sp. D173a]MDK9755922.1 hypothetical protein [Vibrio sp. D173a]
MVTEQQVLELIVQHAVVVVVTVHILRTNRPRTLRMEEVATAQVVQVQAVLDLVGQLLVLLRVIW